jgi:hypothetical protein
MEVKITADVYCDRDAAVPAYRIYVNHDLITERTFSWSGTDTFIRENMICDLEPGQHQVRLEPVDVNGTFMLRDVTVDGRCTDSVFNIN